MPRLGGTVVKVRSEVGTDLSRLEANSSPVSFLWQPPQVILHSSQHHCPRPQSFAPWSLRHLEVDWEISALTVVIFIQKSVVL